MKKIMLKINFIFQEGVLNLGESIEYALRRDFKEEVSCTFQVLPLAM
jgi:ADP-ribose pyrophosphatase YjhB (NUDIX family)